MFSLDDIVKRLVNYTKTFFKYSAKLDKHADERESQLAFNELKEQLSARRAHKKKIDLQEYTAPQRWFYRFGFLLVMGVLLASLVVFSFSGDFHREWINPYSPSLRGGGQAIDANQLAVALLGAIGVPPFVIALCLCVFLVGWLLMLRGLQSAHPVYSIPFAAILTGQLWLLFAGVSTSSVKTLLANSFPDDLSSLANGPISIQLLLPLCFGVVFLILSLLGWLLRNKRLLSFLIFLAQAATMGLVTLAIFTLTPKRMDLMLGLSAAQISTLGLLFLYWYILGHDALDGTVNLGHWYGRLGLRFLKSRLLTALTLLLLALGSLPFLLKSAYNAAFASLILVSALLLLYQWLRSRRPPTLLAINALLLSLVILVIAPKAFGAFFPSFGAKKGFLFLSPIFLYIYSTIWSFYASGPIFINRSTSRLPSPARLFMHIGWVLLASNCLLFFVAARDDMFMLLSSQITAEAFLIVGVPFFLYLLATRPRHVLIVPPEMNQATPQDDTTADAAPPSEGEADTTADPAPTSESEKVGALPGAASQEAQTTTAHTSTGFPAPESSYTRFWAIVALVLGLGFLGAIQLVRGLAVVNYSKVAYHTAQGNLHLRANRLSKAIASYDRALLTFQYNFKPHILKAVAQQKMNQLDDAIDSLKSAVTIQPDAVDTWLQLGSLYRLKRRYKDAITAYKKALVIDPSDSFTYRNLALAYSYLGNTQKALNQIAQAFHYLPGNNEFGNNHYPAKAFILIRAKRYKEAMVALRKGLKLNPNDHLALYDMGVVLRRLKQPHKARAYFQKAHRLRPDKSALLRSYVSLLQLLIYKGERKYLKEAMDALQLSFDKNRENPDIAAQYVFALFNFKRYKEAQKVLTLALKQHKNAPDLHMLQARLYLIQRRYPKAQTYLEGIRQAYPKHKKTLQLLIRVLLIQRKVPQAQALLQKLRKEDPKNRDALFYSAYLLRRQRRYAEAFKLYQTLLKHHPHDRESVYFAALLSARFLRKYDLAYTYYRRLLHKQPDKRHPQHILSLRYYGLSAIRLRPPRLDTAIEAYQRILKLKGGLDFGAASNLSIVYSKTKQFEKAAQMYRIMRKLKPQLLFYQMRLAIVLSKTTKTNEAITAYKTLYKLLAKIPNRTYNRVYRRQMRNFSRSQVMRYCSSSIRRLQKTRKRQPK